MNVLIKLWNNEDITLSYIFLFIVILNKVYYNKVYRNILYYNILLGDDGDVYW